MTIIEKLNKIEYLDQLIRLKSTGTPHKLAIKMDLSERQVRRYIEEMKNMGATIQYNEFLSTYEYLQPLKFQYGFVRIDMKRIIGGFLFDGHKMSVSNNIFASVITKMVVTPGNPLKRGNNA